MLGRDFDVKTFVQNLRATKPPYECPYPNCGKIYKSHSGIQFHLFNFDHENPENNTPSKPSCKKGSQRSPSPADYIRSREQLSYAEAQKIVEIEVDGKIHRLNIYDKLEVISQDQLDNCENTEKEKKSPEKNAAKSGKGGKGAKGKDGKKTKDDSVPQPTKLPEAKVKELSPSQRKIIKAPKRPSSFFRYIDKTNEELDEEIEYDMDEEDQAWLELINAEMGVKWEVEPQTFEHLFDRFEKEAFFQSQTSGHDNGPPIDEDAVCSICMDGECQNSNVILFCDMCNLAVHQECYGVPYIPEGQWLCRRCLQSPSRAVDCCLCPNKGGAFKQTDDGRWAHVVCALWIPEVGFANTVFLEPIDCIGRIPSARWKLSCYVCKQRGVGACIQCHKTNCYTAFHVTCAQQAGLFMKIEPVREMGINGVSINVRKTAYCDVHGPADADSQPMIDNGIEGGPLTPEEIKSKNRQKMRKARKILAERRNSMPVVSIPCIPQTTIAKIASKIGLAKKSPFLNRLYSYWMLKRQSRNGVPLLRRLQSNHMSSRRDSDDDEERKALKAQLKYWQRLRQDLEKARLLVELIRKRERLKREQIRIEQQAIELKLTPFLILLRDAVQMLEERDTSGIFAEPVSLEEVPDYRDVIKHPMDLQTMRQKVEGHKYRSMDDFEADFNLMIQNCMTYNSKETVFFRSAVKLRDQGGIVLRAARRMYDKVGIDGESGLHTESIPEPPREQHLMEDENFLSPEARRKLPLEQQLRILLDRLDMTQAVRPNKKSKLYKQIKREIQKVRKQLALENGTPLLSDPEDSKSMATTTGSENASTCSSRSPSPEKNVPSPKAAATAPPLLDKEKPHSPTAAISRSSSPQKSVALSPAKGRGRGGRKSRLRSRGSDSENEQPNKDSYFLSTPTKDHGQSVKIPPVDPTATPTRSPAGVNRRTAVLFSSKKTVLRKLSSESPSRNTPASGRKGSRPPKLKPISGQEVEKAEGPTSPVPPTLSPSVRLSRKRSASTNVDADATGASPAKRSPGGPEIEGYQSQITPELPAMAANKESFRYYRPSGNLAGIASSGPDTTSDSCSTDSESETTNAEGDGGPASGRYPNRMTRKTQDWNDEEIVLLEPLDLVWAKCRGYPWYPALIIDPQMPRNGFSQNGIPIPVPPQEVLALSKKYESPIYLVLFFDAKRTWQWLPRNKLEPLGVDSGLDEVKLVDNKKPNVRKAVKAAFEKAIQHRNRVVGDPVPISLEGEDTGSDGEKVSDDEKKDSDDGDDSKMDDDAAEEVADEK